MPAFAVRIVQICIATIRGPNFAVTTDRRWRLNLRGNSAETYTQLCPSFKGERFPLKSCSCLRPIGFNSYFALPRSGTADFWLRPGCPLTPIGVGWGEQCDETSKKRVPPLNIRGFGGWSLRLVDSEVSGISDVIQVPSANFEEMQFLRLARDTAGFKVL